MNYYGNYGSGLFWDPTYILIIVGVVLCAIASVRVNSTYKKYSRVLSRRGFTGEQVARKILDSAGLYNVRIEHINGNLTDHYDPRDKVLRLSGSVHSSTSVAAIGVAAHECGHAIQDATDYVPIRVRNAIVPVVNIGANLSWPLIIAGLIFSWNPLIRLGIFVFSFAVIFQLVTLPVELDASHRALTILGDSGYLYPDELKGSRRVLTAAAMTYVTALISVFLQLLRLILLFGDRGRRD